MDREPSYCFWLSMITNLLSRLVGPCLGLSNFRDTLLIHPISFVIVYTSRQFELYAKRTIA